MRFILVFISIILFAKEPYQDGFEVNLMWLESKPLSIYRDFFIYQYLKKDNISSEDAFRAFSLTKNINRKILFAYAKHSEYDEFKDTIACMKLKPKKLIKTGSIDCILSGLSVYKATKLPYQDLVNIIDKAKKIYPNEIKKYEVLVADLPFVKLISSDEEVFFEVFNSCGKKFRKKYFNYKIPIKTLKRLVNNKKFNQTISIIVTSFEYNNLQESLLELDIKDIEKLNHYSIFLLGINFVRFNKLDKAKEFFEYSLKKAYYRFDRDKVNFWLYLVTDDKKYLEKVSNSIDVNLYSILAKEKLGKKFDNIIYDIKLDTNSTKYYQVLDPFSWLKVLKDTKKKFDLEKYKKLFHTKETLPHLAFVSERFYKYKKAFFITPYSNILKSIDKKRQVLIYAIARQESRFIPTSISYSYALGVMQLMPFLSKAIAKELKDIYNIYEQFNPIVNLRYANKHLNYLTKKLSNPLFIAYAYNAGIGFLNRILREGFFKYNKFEPFFSMEIIPYSETRRYGKKVLANYYIYYNYLIGEIKMENLLKGVK